MSFMSPIAHVCRSFTLFVLILLGACSLPPAAPPSQDQAALPLAPDQPTIQPTIQPAATPAPRPSSAHALQLISRDLSVVASSEYSPAALASDSNYDTTWRSLGLPASLAYDLSPLPAEQRAHVLLVWYNGTYGYTTRMGCQGVGYNNLGAYTIEAHSGPGGGDPPLLGWVTLATVTDNSFHSRQHLLDLAGYTWLRLHATASDGSPQNEDVALNLDLYAVAGAVADGWIFFGDSITAGAMGHATLSGPAGPVASFAEEIFALTGRSFPPQENGGVPCITTADLAPVFADWLARFPGRFVAISLGSNDAMGVSPAQFYERYARMIELVIQAGKVPVVPTIPWSPDPERQFHSLDLNAQIYQLYQAYPELVRGPDLWAFYAEHPQLIAADQLHPTAEGYAAYRQLWASVMAARIYGE